MLEAQADWLYTQLINPGILGNISLINLLKAGTNGGNQNSIFTQSRRDNVETKTTA